jgi:ClpP class serine protease
MSKVGEGKELPKGPSIDKYHKEVEQNASKFLNALESYQTATPEEKAHLKSVMDQTMALMKAAVSEIRYAGINKQEVKVEHDYQQYLQKESPENLSALEEDLQTLRDYNKLK